MAENDTLPSNVLTDAAWSNLLTRFSREVVKRYKNPDISFETSTKVYVSPEGTIWSKAATASKPSVVSIPVLTFRGAGSVTTALQNLADELRLTFTNKHGLFILDWNNRLYVGTTYNFTASRCLNNPNYEIYFINNTVYERCCIENLDLSSSLGVATRVYPGSFATGLLKTFNITVANSGLISVPFMKSGIYYTGGYTTGTSDPTKFIPGDPYKVEFSYSSDASVGAYIKVTPYTEIEVDDELDDTSNNPIANAPVAAAIGTLTTLVGQKPTIVSSLPTTDSGVVLLASDGLVYLWDEDEGEYRVADYPQTPPYKQFNGTSSEWEALTDTEKAAYDSAAVDDVAGAGSMLTGVVEEGNDNAVTSDAVATAIAPITAVIPSNASASNKLVSEDTTVTVLNSARAATFGLPAYQNITARGFWNALIAKGYTNKTLHINFAFDHANNIKVRDDRMGGGMLICYVPPNSAYQCFRGIGRTYEGRLFQIACSNEGSVGTDDGSITMFTGA